MTNDANSSQLELALFLSRQILPTPVSDGASGIITQCERSVAVVFCNRSGEV
jgi:hypothetical protein